MKRKVISKAEKAFNNIGYNLEPDLEAYDLTYVNFNKNIKKLISFKNKKIFITVMHKSMKFFVPMSFTELNTIKGQVDELEWDKTYKNLERLGYYKEEDFSLNPHDVVYFKDIDDGNVKVIVINKKEKRVSMLSDYDDYTRHMILTVEELNAVINRIKELGG